MAKATRGGGVGERLLRAAGRRLVETEAAAGCFLWVMEANGAGLRFYLRLGGEVVGRDVSSVPAANRAPVLRVFSPQLSILAAP